MTHTEKHIPKSRAPDRAAHIEAERVFTRSRFRNLKDNFFLYNADHFRTYSGRGYTPIVEPCRASEDFDRFIDELARNGGDQSAAAQVAGVKFLTVDPAQKMPEKEE